MAFFTWDEKYSVKVRRFDDEHKKLVSLIDQLHEAMRAGKGRQNLGNLLSQLVDYTKTHFVNEEKLMLEQNYPGYSTQKIAHASFVSKIEESQLKFQAGNVSLSVDLFNFLKDWLVTHIQGSDRQYGDFFNGKGIS